MGHLGGSVGRAGSRALASAVVLLVSAVQTLPGQTPSGAAVLRAQECTPACPGELVRVRDARSPDRIEGLYADLRADTLFLRPVGMDGVQAVPVESIVRLDVKRGRRSNVFLGLAIMVPAGILVGTAIAGDGVNGLEGGLYGFVGGVVVGGVIGEVVRSDRWVRVPASEYRRDDPAPHD